MKWLREPLVHFTVIGALLFALYPSPDDDANSNRITLDRPQLIAFYQQQFRIPDSINATERFMTLPDKARQQVIDQWVQEEVLYREALRLGLLEGDTVIRKRLAQKMRFIAEAEAVPALDITPADLSAYVDEHRDRYRTPAQISFSHLYFARDDRDPDGKQALQEARTALNSATLSSTSALGDRFPYHRHYAERDQYYIGSHFGEEFAEEVFALTPDAQKWQGPIASRLGYHLVRVTALSAAATPKLETIKVRVEEDILRERRLSQRAEVLNTLVDRYEVTLAKDLLLDSSDATP
ncbi:conserved hypothetical protein [Luminiphilus syltensis NOR5-1B]|uniref:peptidylprolyl isomerase n=1 Tax=Luminiphilus syltensis NOR5-1B TaxID=565045 RepID=B8KSQ6_9GAMM|nr:peptidylprolyl isomerase [Luminiphilus syltensis]EED34422.1 conserved hypothetical protein [Luminiphilus syltensis NOR5-1B]